jgi:hypothetical protein
MLLDTLFFCFLTCSLVMIFSFHPIFLGGILVSFRLLASFFIFLNSFSWLGFLLFYLIRGGILMLLIYMSCYRFNPIVKRFILLSILISLLLLFFSEKFMIISWGRGFRKISLLERGLSFNFFFNSFFSLLTGIFIFFCFFLIGKILTSFSFTIRPFFLRRNRAVNP